MSIQNNKNKSILILKIVSQTYTLDQTESLGKAQWGSMDYGDELNNCYCNPGYHFHTAPETLDACYVTLCLINDFTL